jgi:hypothetical protein
LALTLSVSTGAVAQTSAPPANTAVTTPKQVGAWTVTGWSQGYCSAERPVRDAAAGGGALQFVLARVQTGYRIALSAPDWELKPQTAFPVQLIADPVLRSDANAIAVAPKVVMIELGADGQLVKKLATAPVLEVKAAQATFKLPMERFADALAEVDSCFGALKRPVANPFAAPQTAPKQSAALPKTETKIETKTETRPSNVQAPGATPTKTASDSSAPKVTPVKLEPASAPPAAAPAKARLHGLRERRPGPRLRHRGR